MIKSSELDGRQQSRQAGIQQHITQAVLSLPFAHVSGLQGLQGADGLAGWPFNQIGSQLVSLSDALVSHVKNNRFPGTPSASDRNPRRRSNHIFASSTASRAHADAKAEAVKDDSEVICIEFTRGKRRVYRQPAAAASTGGGGGQNHFDVRDDAVTSRHHFGNLVGDYLLPQGYPNSVAPQYATYMGWRGVQYFFGGAMSVFTTRSLLRALGVANRNSGEAAAAINWVVKDGAGRLGRFLFARWGRSLDCELKQFRLAGDILMECGAALELSTALAPHLFLPLACTANLAKNLAAVAASSTRAPIYRTFARANNMADVTAKGESVANVADVVGTAFGILLAKMNLPVVPTFAVLSVGYLVASRREVDSVELPYFNRARLSYAARKFFSSGGVPPIPEANQCEPLLPWSDPAGARIVVGATVQDACNGPSELKSALDAFKGRQYALTYRPETKKVYVLLRNGADTEDTMRAVFDAHALLHIMNGGRANGGGEGSANTSGKAVGRLQKQTDVLKLPPSMASGALTHDVAVKFIADNGKELYSQFEKQARSIGWRMSLTMLNSSETRLAVA